jgi:hypothetical protein
VSGAGAFPFDPGRLAALGRLALATQGADAPPPLADPVVVDERGMAVVPVPDADPTIVVDGRGRGIGREVTAVRAHVHPGLTLQWAPIAEQGGVLLSLRGGPPDGDPDRDGVVAFVTLAGLQALARDLAAIAAKVEADR